MMFKNLFGQAGNNIKTLMKQISECGPEAAVESSLGDITNTIVVGAGGLFGGIATQIETPKGNYAIYGALNGNFQGRSVTLREWPVSGGSRYLIIDGKKHKIVD